MTPNIKYLPFSKFLLALFAALALTGCLPVPMFEVTPSTARAGIELTFDASGSVVSNTPEDNVAVGWAWEFGDGKTARGESVTHTYEKDGTYTIKLTVTDSAGRQARIEEALVVEKALLIGAVNEAQAIEEKTPSSTASPASTAAR